MARFFPIVRVFNLSLLPCWIVGQAVVISQAGCIQQARSACGFCSSFNMCVIVVVGVSDKLSKYLRRVYHHHTLSLLEAKCFKLLLVFSGSFPRLFYNRAPSLHFISPFVRRFRSAVFYFPLLEKWGQCCIPSHYSRATSSLVINY